MHLIWLTKCQYDPQFCNKKWSTRPITFSCVPLFCIIGLVVHFVSCLDICTTKEEKTTFLKWLKLQSPFVDEERAQKMISISFWNEMGVISLTIRICLQTYGGYWYSKFAQFHRQKVGKKTRPKGLPCITSLLRR